MKCYYLRLLLLMEGEHKCIERRSLQGILKVAKISPATWSNIFCRPHSLYRTESLCATFIPDKFQSYMCMLLLIYSVAAYRLAKVIMSLSLNSWKFTMIGHDVMSASTLFPTVSPAIVKYKATRLVTGNFSSSSHTR